MVLINSNCTDLSGFENLETAKSLAIENNHNLTSFDGLSTDFLLDNSFYVAYNENLVDINVLNANPNFTPNSFRLLGNTSLSECCTVYPILSIASTIHEVQLQENGAACSEIDQVILDCAPPATHDIEISMRLSTQNPDAFAFYSVFVEVENKGNQEENWVSIDFNLAEGAVFEGGNEYEASTGYFNHGADTPNWYMYRLKPGEKATMEMRFFNLSSAPKTYYAVVMSTLNMLDDDSTFGNGAYPIAAEDDEAVASTGDAISLPDLQISNIQSVASGLPGEIVSYTFGLQNSGTVASEGDYTIGGYLSTDSVLSDDDLKVSEVLTGNTPKGSIGNVYSELYIPSDLAAGNYFFILKADIGDEVDEQLESNNTDYIPFSITDMQPEVCVGDVELSTQAEVDAFNCSHIEGDLLITGPIENIDALIVLQSVTGELHISTTELSDLDGLQNLVSAKDVILVYNRSLLNIEGLASISSEMELFVFIENDKVKNVQAMQNSSFSDLIIASGNDRLESLEGLENSTSVNYVEIVGNASLTSLSGLNGLTEVTGNLYISSPSLTSLNGLQNITKVDGQVLIISNDKLTSLNGLGGLVEAEDFILSGNPSLTSLDALTSLMLVEINFVVAYNNALSSFCGIYDMLDNGINAEITITDNELRPDITVDQILAECHPTDHGSDLSISLEVSDVNAPAYDFFSITLTIKNDGIETAENVEVSFPIPTGAVLEGGNEYEASTGSYDTWENFVWSGFNMIPSETQTITLNLYRLTTDAVDFYAEVVTQVTHFDNFVPCLDEYGLPSSLTCN